MRIHLATKGINLFTHVTLKVVTRYHKLARGVLGMPIIVKIFDFKLI